MTVERIDPLDRQIERMARATGVSWETSAPYHAAEVGAGNVGFADDRVIGIHIYCHARDRESMVPIARQLVFQAVQKLEEEHPDLEGLTAHLKIRPSLQPSWKKKRFLDTNQRSPTKGKMKMGQKVAYAFFVGNFPRAEWIFVRGKLPTFYMAG